MQILEKILANKRLEIEQQKAKVPTKDLEKLPSIVRECTSLRKALERNGSSGIIAEFKRRSPSKGIISENAISKEVCSSYQAAEASALSILTDEIFFGGHIRDIQQTRQFVELPIIRKEFIIDEYQVLESKAIGADAILLIAAAISVEEFRTLSNLARSLGLEVLLEVHSKQELVKYLNESFDCIGVNNRNLKSFDVSQSIAMELAEMLPKNVVKVAESGLTSANDILALRKFGYNGFLIGEYFMKDPSPGERCAALIEELKCA